MNSSGDAAEQVVRLSLEGTEAALKLTGSAAKNIAAALYAVLKNRDKNKTRGRQRLTAMLKSGKELKVFSIRDQRLRQFAAEARRYGVVYCALRGKRPAADGVTDILVRAEDAAKINRIVERFHLAAVDAAIRPDNGRGEKTAASGDIVKKDFDKDEEQLLEELLTKPATGPKKATAKPQEHAAEGKAPRPAPGSRPLSFLPKINAPQNPSPARTNRVGQGSPSGLIFAPPVKTAAAADSAQRPSVRKTLHNLLAKRTAAEKKRRQALAAAVHNKIGTPAQGNTTVPGSKNKDKPKERIRV